MRRHGKMVLNESIGIARGYRPEDAHRRIPVEPQTPFPVLSAGKPLAALAIALLESRGLLDIQRPIAQFWPAFAQHGKDLITTLDVLTHRSGLLMPAFVHQSQLWGNREAVIKALIETRPTYPRGTLAYHPHEFGWLLSEITHRIIGQSLADFIEAEFSAALGLPNLYFGLGDRDIDQIGYLYWLGPAEVRVAGVNVAADFENQNSSNFLASRNPATTLVCDAASLAAFYEWILNTARSIPGPITIDKDILRTYTSRQVFGWDRSLRTPIVIGRGFVIGSRWPSTFGLWNTGECFGHAGGFSCLAFGDYRTNIAGAIVTNGNRNLIDSVKRFMPLAQGLRMACHQ